MSKQERGVDAGGATQTGAAIAARLLDQAASCERLLSGAYPVEFEWRPEASVWSARDHLAHLGRYAHVFRGRVEEIVSGATPSFAPYRAPDDDQFRAWQVYPLIELRSRMSTARMELAGTLRRLTTAESARCGRHASYGLLTLVQWTDFYLIHEAHYYTVLRRLSGAREAMNETYVPVAHE